MNKSKAFTQPINPIAGNYPTNWPGYYFLQPRISEGKPNLLHIGVDYNGPGGGNTDLGQEVYAISDGLIEKIIPWNRKYGFGNHLFIRHQLSDHLKKKYNCEIIYSHYAHLQEFKCHEGQIVTKGQLIAKLGNSGTKYAHLHLEIRKPTGLGYESYPTGKGSVWLRRYYFDSYLFIEDNTTEPVEKETTSESPSTTPDTIPPGETGSETPPAIVVDDDGTGNINSRDHTGTRGTDIPRTVYNVQPGTTNSSSSLSSPQTPQAILQIRNLIQKIIDFLKELFR